MDQKEDPKFKMILWYLVSGTIGGVTRAKILNLIKDTQMNANQIAIILNLTHKTITYHLKILLKNELVVKTGQDYGAKYQLTPIMKENQSVLDEIMQKIGIRINQLA